MSRSRRKPKADVADGWAYGPRCVKIYFNSEAEVEEVKREMGKQRRKNLSRWVREIVMASLDEDETKVSRAKYEAVAKKLVLANDQIRALNGAVAQLAKEADAARTALYNADWEEAKRKDAVRMKMARDPGFGAEDL